MTGEAIQKQDKDASLVVPDFLKNVVGHEGLENVTKDDLVLPRLMICQGLSPQRQRGKVNYIEGLQDGQLFNTVTNEVYGESVRVVPLLFTKSRILFKAMTEGGGILCQSFNGIDGGRLAKLCAQCPKSQFTPELPPECTNFMNFVSVLLPSKQLIAVSFKSTAIKKGKNWNTNMTMKNKPSYSQVWEIKTTPETNTKGTFFSPVMTFQGFTQDQELYKFAKGEYESLRGQVIQTDETGADDAAESEATPF